MKTMLTLIILALTAASALAAPVGTQTSQATTANVTIDGYGYRLNSVSTYQRTSQGMTVSLGPGILFSTQQPAGPQGNVEFNGSFTIPADVIFGFYK